jgi:2-polyprenyl-3-methyl-5-hydroxy-6-metoxy-1,4-benzoquinol methylase
MTLLKPPDLARRQRRPEIMDRPDLDPAKHAAALEGLGRINRLSRSGAVLWSAVERLARQRGGMPLRVLDLASGGGDIAVSLARRAARAGLDVQISGCDVSPIAVRFAGQHAEAERVDVRFFEYDALAGDLPGGYDVLTSTLFLHHLDDPEAVGLLRRMREAAGRAVLVDDLVRNRWGLALAWAGCRLLTRSEVVHHDGPASVSAAFTPGEVLDLARQAGLEGASLTRHWPQRFLLAWSRP